MIIKLIYTWLTAMAFSVPYLIKSVAETLIDRTFNFKIILFKSL